MEKFKWQIVNIQPLQDKLRIVVDFAYGWKKVTEQVQKVDEKGEPVFNEDGNPVMENITRLDYKQERKEFEFKIIPTKQQLRTFLNNYWANHYAEKDAYEKMLDSLNDFIGMKD